MTMSTWQRLDRFGRNLAPGALTLFFVLFSATPIGLPGFSRAAPALALTSVYYWTIHRPDLLRPSALFVIGLLQDLITGGVIGIGPLTFVTVHWILLNQRRLFLAGTFPFMWFGLALTVFSVVSFQWMAHTALHAAPMPIGAPVTQALLTLALFPAMTWVLAKIHRAFLSD